jgi:hypothetical protein
MLQLLVSACKTLANMLMKAEVLDESDMENSWGVYDRRRNFYMKLQLLKFKKRWNLIVTPYKKYSIDII